MYRFIDVEKANHSVRTLCRVLRVARSAFYAWLRGEARSARASRDAVLLVHIRAVHRRSRGTYGSRRVWRQLRHDGFAVGRRRVARLMRLHGLRGLPSVSYRGSTTDSDHEQPVAPNVLERNFTADAPNVAWVGDITYLPTQQGWVYLAVLLDLYSRKVVGWALADHMRTELCLAALRSALATREPAPGAIHHSDRGSQYASQAYRDVLTKHELVQSMSRRGNCHDNAVAESFFGTLEQELAGRVVWSDESEARAAVSDYIHRFYNAERLHSHLGYQSPVGFETASMVERQAA